MKAVEESFLADAFDGLEEAQKSIVPLSKTMKEDIDSLQQWAKTRARQASIPGEREITKSVRRIK